MSNTKLHELSPEFVKALVDCWEDEDEALERCIAARIQRNDELTFAALDELIGIKRASADENR